MQIPLILLSIGAISSGFVGKKLLHIADATSPYWNGVILKLNSHYPVLDLHNLPLFIAWLPLIVGLLGIMVAFALYLKHTKIPSQLSSSLKALYKVLLNKYYFDELYNKLFVSNTSHLSKILWKRVDVFLIDGVLNGLALLVGRGASRLSALQSGYIYHYAILMAAAIIALLYWVVFYAFA